MPSRQVIIGCLFVLLLAACGHDAHFKVGAIDDRTATPIPDARGVSTLISDSGVTRYRINAEHWQVFDKSDPTYWEFTDGVYLEKFDKNLKVEASIRSDYARYFDQKGLWKLLGNVHAMNEKGEEFDTPRLLWNQNTGVISSDTTISIRRATSKIVGIGFQSNQTMTEYIILQPTGFFPIGDNENTRK